MTEEDRLGEFSRDTPVLVVDDEPDIRDSLKSLLEDEFPKVHVVTAANGPEGIEAAQERRPRLVIADYRMPEMDGLEFLDRIDELRTRGNRAAAPTPPRILVTAYADVELIQRAINEELVDRVFTKPLDPDEIVATVRDLLFDSRHPGRG